MNEIEENKTSLKDLPISKVIPNMITMTAAAAGMTSIRLSADGNWSLAIIAIMIAAVCDGLDGRVARMLNAQSKIGAELDSLCDFLNFGVAPALLMFFWSMKNAVGIGWVLCIAYAMCCLFRLARFNTMMNENPPSYWDYFFVGLPAPGGALVVLMPVMLYLYFLKQGEDYAYIANSIRSVWVGSFALFISGFLMASRIPTMSLKKLKIKAKYMLPCLFLFALIAGFLFTDFWLVLGSISAVYLLSVPATVILFLKLKSKYKEN